MTPTHKQNSQGGPGTPGFEQELRDALFACDPDLARTEWVSIGIAAKENGLAYEDFDQWSALGGKYPGPRETRTQWNAFGRGDVGAVNYQTIFHFAYQNGWKPTKDTRSATSSSTSGLHRARANNRPSPGRGRAALDGDAGSQESARDQQRARVKKEQLASLLLAAKPADKYHPYLVRKQISPEGILQIKRSALFGHLGYEPSAHGHTPLSGEQVLVCAYHDGQGAGHPKTVELIDENGLKTLLAGLHRAKTMWSLEPINPAAKRHFVVEGVATAKSVIGAIQERQVFAAGAKNNLGNVVAEIRRRSPGSQIIVLSDLGEDSEKTAREAAEVGAGHAIAPPESSLPEGGSDFNDMAAASGLSAVAEWIESHSTHPNQITFAGAKHWRKIDYVLPGLERGSVGMIVGPGSVGKTFLALELCASVALGLSLPRLQNVFYEKGQGNTCLLLGEDSVDQISNRLHSMRGFFPLDDRQVEQLDERMLVLSRLGQEMTLVDSSNHAVTETAFVEYLRHLCWGRRLAVIDPLVRLHNGDENDNTAASRLMMVITRIAKETNCSIVLLHHVGKGDRDDWAAARGASAFNTSARWQLNIRGMNKTEAEELKVDPSQMKEYVRCTGAKMNYGPGIDHFWLRRTDGGVLVHTDPGARADIAAADADQARRVSRPIPQQRNLQVGRRSNPGSPQFQEDE